MHVCNGHVLSISNVPSTWDVQLIQSHIPCGRDVTSWCHGMAILLLLHCSMLLMLVVTGNRSDQLMERVMHC